MYRRPGSPCSAARRCPQATSRTSTRFKPPGGAIGIPKIQLLYHGTTDPAVYGIDYALYRGSRSREESPWLAVSSYFLVGLPARLTTSQGVTLDPVSYQLGTLRARPPEARPAGCMYLFRLR